MRVEARGAAEPRGHLSFEGQGVHEEFWPVLVEYVLEEHGAQKLLVEEDDKGLKVPGGQEMHFESSGDA